MTKKRKGAPLALSREAVRSVLQQAARLEEESGPEEARALLARQVARHPRNGELLEAYLNASLDSGDMRSYQDAVERLLVLRPDDAALTLAHAGAAVQNIAPFTALASLRRFLARWPTDARAPEARDMLGQLEAMAPETLSGLGLAGEGERAEALAARHEQVQQLLAVGRLQETREEARALHRAVPQLLAPLNNLGQAEWEEGHLPEAEAAFREVLATRPDNVHALSNLARVLFVTGRTEEARELAGRMKASTAQAADRWAKEAEVLALLGDDAGVLEAWRHREAEVDKEYPPQLEALLFQYAAASALRLGDEPTARRLWNRALHLAPTSSQAQDNLAALSLPRALRPAPWAIPLEAWLPPPLFRSIVSRMVAAAGRGGAALKSEAERVFRDVPALAHLLCVWLDRGSRDAVELVLRFAAASHDEKLLAAVRDFALGERGALDQRVEAASIALRAGVAREEELLLWTGGPRRQPFRWFDRKVTEEPTRQHARRVQALEAQALGLLRAGEGVQAEALLREALAQEPDASDLLNNLATAFALQGREKEADETVEALHARHPDYLFARAAVARLRVRDGRLEEARRLLEPLLGRRTLHSTEMSALCAAHIELLLAEGDREGARVWLHLMETECPEARELEQARYRVVGPDLFKPAGGGGVLSP